MKWIVRFTLLVVSSSLSAETLLQPSYRITLDDGWVYTIEQAQRVGFGDRISIRPPNRSGVLEVQSLIASGPVDREVLRTMTNVAHSEPLEWQAWGDFSGYQHSYV